MAEPFIKNIYYETKENLPAQLEKGCKYFCKKEKCIIVDLGKGPVEYGENIYTSYLNHIQNSGDQKVNEEKLWNMLLHPIAIATIYEDEAD